MNASVMTDPRNLVNPGGGSRFTGRVAIVTATVSAPGLTAMDPGPTTVSCWLDPDAERNWPSAVGKLPSTPLHAVSLIPPSVKVCDRVARTASTTLSGFGSGKFWTLVATYVAIVKPPALIWSTRWYVFPTGVKVASLSTSMTRWSTVPLSVSYAMPPGGGGGGALTATFSDVALVAPWLSVTINVTV